MGWNEGRLSDSLGLIGMDDRVILLQLGTVQEEGKMTQRCFRDGPLPWFQQNKWSPVEGFRAGPPCITLG